MNVMKLYKIRGGNKEDLENKKYNLGVGISLGNKWFSIENIIGLVRWALQYSKNEVIIYVADSIHAINLEVRNKISYEKALQKAEKQGSEILSKVKSEIEQKFPKEVTERIVYVKWNEIGDEKFKQKIEYLKSLYNQNVDFQNTIHLFVKGFVSKEEREFSKEEIHRLGEYIIEELPEIMNRLSMGKIICDAFIYPYDGELAEFAEQLQKGERFPEIKENIMDTEPKVFLEVR